SVALARAWSGPQSLPARTLASDYLARQGRWTEVAELAEAAEGSDRALLDHVRLLRARALIELSRREEAVAVIPRDARSEIARDLAMEAVAGPRRGGCGRRAGVARAGHARAAAGSGGRDRFARGAVWWEGRPRALHRGRRLAHPQCRIRGRGADPRSLAAAGPAAHPGEL